MIKFFKIYKDRYQSEFIKIYLLITILKKLKKIKKSIQTHQILTKNLRIFKIPKNKILIKKLLFKN